MYIVTGGAGFIGSMVVAKLNAMGIKEILIVDNLGTSDKWLNLKGLQYLDYLHKDAFIKHIRAGSLPGVTVDHIQGVIHMGACSATTETNMDYLMENNFHYTRSLAEFCISNGIRFIYASSGSTYGAGTDGFSDDEDGLYLLKPQHRYGYSKHIFDLWAHESGASSKIVGLKFFNVYGPNEYHKGFMCSVAHAAYKQIKATGKFKLFRSYNPKFAHGEQMRDFVYVKDCADVMWWFLNNPQANGLYNLGSGQARTFKDFALAVFTALGVTPDLEYIDMPEHIRNQYQYYTEAEMQKLKQAGYNDKLRTLEEGVKDYVLNYLEKRNA